MKLTILRLSAVLLCLTAAQGSAANIITTTITAPSLSLSPVVNGAATVGQTQGYLINFTDVAGWHDIGAVQVNFCGETGSNLNACIVYVDVVSKTIWLLNDAGNWDQHSVLVTPGVHLANSQIDVNVQASGMVTGGNTVTLAISVAYKTSVAWRSVWGIASDQYWQYSQGWTAYGWMNVANNWQGSFNILPVAPGAFVPDDYNGDIVQSETSAGTTASTLALNLRGGRRVTIHNAGKLRVARADYSHALAGAARKYTFRFDVREVKSIRLGAVWDNEYTSGAENLPEATGPAQITQPKGWHGNGVSWIPIGDAELSDNAEFTVMSKYLPGLMPVYFENEHWMDALPMTGHEDGGLVVRAGFMNNSLRKFVIGPAIHPDRDQEYLKALVGIWVDKYGFEFLRPFLKDGATLEDIPAPAGAFEAEVLQCLRDAWPPA